MSLKHSFAALACASAIALAGCSGAAAGESGAPAVATPKDGKVTMEVTEAGFVPARIKAKKGEPLTLVITRKTDATCAKDIVIDEHNVHTALPLNKAVSVTFTPNKTGELKFGCAMDKMVGGVLLIE
jgi:plastocyanin domain-containing protein